MTRKPLVLPLLLTTLLSANASYADTNTDNTTKATHLSTITDAKPIERVEPKYPMHQQRAGREGWTALSYVVETDGSVSNIIVQKSSGYKDFDRSAVKAMKKWTYNPAMENGKAIQQCRNSVRINFAMSGHNDGVSQRFLSAYKKIKADLEQGDLAGAKTQIGQLKGKKQNRFSEIAYLSVLQADYAEKTGNDVARLSHLSDATYSGDGLFSTEYINALLQQKYQLEVSLNKLRQANMTYQKIIAMKINAPYVDELGAHQAKLNAFINGQENISVKAIIGDAQLWHHSLVRNEFSLVNIQGKVNKLDVRCANQRHVFSVENNHTWTIPATWKRCDVYVYGTENSHFQLIEHPFAESATATAAAI